MLLRKNSNNKFIDITSLSQKSDEAFQMFFETLISKNIKEYLVFCTDELNRLNDR